MFPISFLDYIPYSERVLFFGRTIFIKILCIVYSRFFKSFQLSFFPNFLKVSTISNGSPTFKTEVKIANSFSVDDFLSVFVFVNIRGGLGCVFSDFSYKGL